MKDFKNVMIDIETLDTVETAVILSVAVVPFDMVKGAFHDHKFYKAISIESNLFAKRTISADTLKWWLKQDEGARVLAFEGEGYFHTAMHELRLYLKSLNPDVLVWANSPRFDVCILQHALRTCGMEWPLSFRNERDVRTFVKAYPLERPKWDKTTEHHPVVDCLDQIDEVMSVWHGLEMLKVPMLGRAGV